MVYNAGELSLIEYGRNELLGSARTEHTSPHLISVRLNESISKEIDDNKKIAYLIDLQTIRVLVLVSGITVATVSLDTKVPHLAARRLLRCPDTTQLWQHGGLVVGLEHH